MEASDIIRMTNQIAVFFRAYGHDEALKEIANHINNFWEPRMRKMFFDYIAQGGKDFAPMVMNAAAMVRKVK